GGTVQTVEIASLHIHPDFQIRARLDGPTVARYANVIKAGNTMPPLKVALVDGAAVLVDGFHRVAAMQQVGQTTAPAEVVVADRQAALWLAAQANLANSLPLSAGDFRRVFQAFVKGGRVWNGKPGRSTMKSYRQIADELGGLKSYGTIRTWMKQDFNRVFHQMGGAPGYPEAGGVKTDRPTSLLRVALTSLEAALAASRGVTDPEARGRLIQGAEKTLQAMKDGAPWAPVKVGPAEEFEF
ncbi:MAG: hypothetical protein JWL84_4269, partial [Rhodospirillales bacterium]|nr:hypothetical protein [Rhodospirillales bacterium]